MSGATLYELHIAGAVTVYVAIDRPIGGPETLRVHIGDLVLVIDPTVADELADALIEAAADADNPVTRS